MTLLGWPAILIAFLTTLIGGAGIGGMFKTWLDHKRGKRAQTDQVALTLVGQLKGRVEALEQALAREHARCEAQLGAQRHQINNLKGMLDALLLVWDMPPAKRNQHIEAIRARRNELERLETMEKLAIVTAPLQPPPEVAPEGTTAAE